MKYEGEVRELDLIPALVELGSESFTGALRFEADSIIKIVYFKDGAVLSASTNDRPDSIDEILLKSGKVSREHVKQALSKRKDDESLGDALLGLGFITRKELTWARRVQLVGVLRSILTWKSGAYTLVADYLPKREEGPSFPLEQVVLELVLTDGDRSKYDALLESGATVFRPSITFEEKFHNLGLNQEAEAVVRLINGSRSASEVVAESTSDAFNVYKLMHALHLLGLLEKSSASFDLGMDEPAAAPTIEPTIEIPVDFGSLDLSAAKESTATTLDYEPPSAEPSVDMSWQEPVEEEFAPPPSGGDLLPSIDDALTPGSSNYDYEPSVPVERAPGLDRETSPPSLESLSSLEIPEPPVSEPEPGPVHRKVLVQKAPSGGGGRKLAFVTVALVLVVALAYAGWVYMSRTTIEEPAPQAEQAQGVGSPQIETPAGTDTVEGSEASTDTEPASPTETPAPESQQPAPAKTQAAEPSPTPPSPKPAPMKTGSTRFSELAQQNARSAAGVRYTVQFALLCQESSVEGAMKVGGSDFWFVPITYQGRSCYRAFWGRYSSREDAERATSQVPASLKGGKAVVVEPAKLVN